MSSSNSFKMGFWAVLAFVVSAQVGSGVFLFPHTLAPFGGVGLFSWLITGGGAIMLALVFARLCTLYPETGGPHVYASHAFGKTTGFFVAWAYWVLAWFSSTPLLATIAGAMCTLMGVPHSPTLILFIELLVLTGLTFLNLRGVQTSGAWEIFMTSLKTIPLILFPLCALLFFDVSNLAPFTPPTMPWGQALNSAALMTIWGFLGIETATAPAGSIQNPKRTIPRAIVFGTIIVVIIYLLNSVAVMGIVPRAELLHTVTPYAAAFEKIAGFLGERVMALFIIVVCLGAMNVWLLTAGQVAKGAADDGLFPKFFGHTNKHHAPGKAIVVSACLLGVCLVALADQTLSQQILIIIEISVIAYLGIYFFSTLSLLKFLKRTGGTWVAWTVCMIALIFCLWALWGAGLRSLLWASLLPASGIPFILWWRRSNRQERTRLL